MNKHSSISILGAGGHGRSVYSWMLQSNILFDQIQFVDPNKRHENELIFTQPILKVEWEDILDVDSESYLLAIGDNHLRRRLYEMLLNNNRNVIGTVHNSAVLGYDVQIDKSVSVGPGVIVGPAVVVGINTVINSGAIIEHESVIGHHCHIAPGTKIAGRVQVGNDSFIGIGAVVIENIKIGRNVTVGAGAVVISDIPSGAVVAGVPAKIIRFE